MGTLGNNFNYDVPFTNEGIQGVDLNYKNFSANIDPNKNYNLGYQTNRDGWNTGVNYDSDGNLMATVGTNFNKGGRAGYSKGRLVKGALAILNRNKKNAEYMFKASDNVSPGYAAGDIKYNAELLAEQLAEDAGILYEDLGALEQTKFYGTAYDYLAKEMMQYRQMTKMLTDVEQKMKLSDFSIKGRKPSASGGLAGILEV